MIMKNFKVDYLLMYLAAVYCISAVVNGNDASVAILQGTFPYVLLYCGIRIFIGTGRGRAEAILILLFSFWLCRESVIGLQQVLGHRLSRHAAFGMTGSFDNPGPFGGFVSILLSLVTVFFIRHIKSFACLSSMAFRGFLSVRLKNMCRSLYVRWILLRFIPLIISGIALFLGFIVLPASASRAGWVAFALSLLLYITVETDWVRRLVRHKTYLFLAVAAVLVVSAGVFLMKKDSAIGRLHIWNMEIRAIAESPWVGTGPGSAMGAYGEAQEQYFRNGNGSTDIVRIAGSPEYAFNEYLKVGMETGIPGLLLAMFLVAASVYVLLKYKSPFAYGLSAAAVFSFFSYPLSVPTIAVTITIFFAVAASCGDGHEKRCPVIAGVAAVVCIPVIGFVMYNECRRNKESDDSWRSARQMSSFEMYDDAIAGMERLYPEMLWNHRYLYDYGYALHKAGRYAESNEIMQKGAKLSSDPMFHNIIGKNFSAMEQYDIAEEEFIKAHYMVPCRLYPLVLLYGLYETAGRDEDMKAVGMKILSMPVNPKNRTMKELKEKIEREMAVI